MLLGYGFAIPLIAPRGGNETPGEVLELETGDELLTEAAELLLTEG